MKGTVFKIDDRLFERGQTWNECVEDWTYQRALFLKSVSVKNALTRTSVLLKRIGHGRLALIYGEASLDSLIALPYLGKTLDAFPGIQARFFRFELFFPVLFPGLGRRVPRLLSLDGNGAATAIWGPRPETMTQELSQVPDGRSRDFDIRFMQMVRRSYPKALDDALVSALEQHYIAQDASEETTLNLEPKDNPFYDEEIEFEP